jgi:hypothetical protein
VKASSIKPSGVVRVGFAVFRFAALLFAIWVGLCGVASNRACAVEGTFDAVETWSVTLSYRDWNGFTGTREFTGQERGRIFIRDGVYTLANKVGHHLSGVNLALIKREIASDGNQYSIQGGDVIAPVLGAPASAAVFLGAFIVSVPLLDGEIPTFEGVEPYAASGEAATITGGGAMTSPSLTASVQSELSLTVPTEPPPGTDGPFGRAAGNYSGVFVEPSAILPDSSGLLTVRVTARGTFSARLTTIDAKVGFSGQLDPNGRFTNNVRLGAQTVRVVLELDPEGSGPVTGSISAAEWTSAVDAQRAAFDLTMRPAVELANRYTLRIRGGFGSDQPKGDGIASVEISLAGQATLKGTLADGTPLVSKGALSGDGRWPVFQKLPGGRTFILGWLEASAENASAIQGVVFWSRPPGTKAAVHPDGFDLTTTVEGSLWHPFKAAFLVENSPIEFRFSEGNLAEPLATEVTFSAPGKIDGDATQFQFKLSLFTGLFSGTFKPSVDAPAIRFKGALLPDQSIGAGFFLGTNSSGLVQTR